MLSKSHNTNTKHNCGTQHNRSECHAIESEIPQLVEVLFRSCSQFDFEVNSWTFACLIAGRECVKDNSSNSAAKDPNENEDEDQENSANVNPAATTYKNAVAIAATAAGTAVAAYVVSALIGDDLWQTWTTPLKFSAQCQQTFAFCQSRHPKRKYCRLMNRLVEECEDVVPHAERVEMFKFYSETLNCTTPHEQRWFNLP